MGFYDDISTALLGNPLVANVDVLPIGHVRIQTVFIASDGNNIDIFVDRDRRDNGYVLTDFGQTMESLLNFQIKPWESPMRLRFLADAIKTYGVERDGGALEYKALDIGRVNDALLNLSQACLRASDLVFTSRDSSPRISFHKEVRTIIDGTGLEYSKKYKLEGRFGKEVVLDYFVQGITKDSLVLALDAKNLTESESRAGKVFAKWYDLNNSFGNAIPITIFDDGRASAYRDEDLDRLATISKLIPVSDHHKLREQLRAAA